MYKMIERYRDKLLLMKYMHMSLELINDLSVHEFDMFVKEIKEKLKNK